VRTPGESQQARGTYSLSRAERATSEDAERKSVSRGTHFLSRVEGGTNEDTERTRASEGYSHPVEGRGRDK
jgi:hypothetical protein